MFTYDVIHKFNYTDINIYKFIFANLDKIPYMTIRELSYYPICDGFPSNTVIIALSESGESKELINMISAFLQKGYYIMSVTNHSQSTLSAMSDWNISYNMKRIRANGGFNATTQVPVLFILEAIARRL